MKKFSAVLCGIFAASFIFAEVQQFNVHYEPVTASSSFDVAFIQYDCMKETSVRRTGGVPVAQAFTAENGLYEERFTLFEDTGSSSATRKMEYLSVVMEYAAMAAGRKLPVSAFKAFEDKDIAEGFNGDFGHTCFVTEPNSTYAGKYDYMMIDFFCKAGQGIVMRTILTNDASIFTEPTDEFVFVYHSFSFFDNQELFW